MKIYIIADTHFNHPAMVGLCNRPADYENKIWHGLRSLSHDSLLIHLGDICIGDDAQWNEIIASLDCRCKILVRGNHDRNNSVQTKIERLILKVGGIYINV